MYLFHQGHSTSQSRNDHHRTQSSGIVPSILSPTMINEPQSPPEKRDKASLGKRASVFALRSRSDTATSTTSFLSRTSTFTGTDESSRRSSQDLRSPPPMSSSSQTMVSEPAAGSASSMPAIFLRRKGLRRQSSKMAIADELEPPKEQSKRTSVLRKTIPGRALTSHGGSGVKYRISNPFDFQHLTHTKPQHLPDLDRTHDNELVAEYWAIRASQMPRRELTGIQAEDLRFTNFSSEEVNTIEEVPNSAPVLGPSPILSPEASPNLSQQVFSTESRSRPLPHSRSVDNLAQFGAPKHRAPRTSSSFSIVAPPRVSSRLALARVDDLQDSSTTLAGRRRSNSAGSSKVLNMMTEAPSSPRRGGGGSGPVVVPAERDLADVPEDVPAVPHAVTTADDTAMPVLSPVVSLGLEQVPEEPETSTSLLLSSSYSNPRPAPRPPMRNNSFSEASPTNPTFPPTSPGRYTDSRQGRYSPFGLRTTSSFSSHTRTPSQLSNAGSNRVATLRRQSLLQGTLDSSSWEDDIDYCYEHAAEADCDYDWDQESQDGEKDGGSQDTEEFVATTGGTHLEDGATLLDGSTTAQNRNTRYSVAFRHSLLLPRPSHLAAAAADQDENAAAPFPDMSEYDARAIVPSDLYTADRVAHTMHADPTKQFIALPEHAVGGPESKFEAIHEGMYEQFISEYATSDPQYALLGPHQSNPSSSRSSRVRFSKHSSYESSLKSGPSSISLSSPSVCRQSASSANSLPELVYSRHARRPTDATIDQLNERITTFELLDKGDDDDDEEVNEHGHHHHHHNILATESNEAIGPDFSTVPSSTSSSIREKGNAAARPAAAVVAVVSEATDSTLQGSSRHDRSASDSAAKILMSASPASTATLLAASSDAPPAIPPKSRRRAATASAGTPVAASLGPSRSPRPPTYTLSLFPTTTTPKPR